MSNNGCYQCQERKPHCHSTCQAHRERKAEYDAKQALIREKKSREHEAISVEVAAKLRALKRRGD
jgi:hypothetical protein